MDMVGKSGKEAVVLKVVSINGGAAGSEKIDPASTEQAAEISIAASVFPVEFSASEIRRILQKVFPQRRLVLSQFTFFNQIGIAKPTGATFRRGRRCYRLEDLLSIASVLALKEEGIPFKNIEGLPILLQEHADQIFAIRKGCKVSGFAGIIDLELPGVKKETRALEAFLTEPSRSSLFWSYEVGLLAEQLFEIASNKDIADRESVAA